MEKKFTIAGTSTVKGKHKLRWSNDIMRVKILAKNGHSNINMIELSEPLTKLEAAQVLYTLPEFQNPDDNYAIKEYILGNGGTLPEGESRVRQALEELCDMA